MNFEDEIKKLIEADNRIRERHEALAESIELMHHDMQEWIKHSKEQQAREDRRYDEMRRAVLRGIVAYLTPEDGHAGENPKA